jgi:hypothetical protein
MILSAALIGAPLVALAQTPTNSGSVCVLAFEDAKQNGARDPGEGALADVGVNLMTNQNVIIANHVTDGSEPYCFPNLAPQQYTVSFSSPLYEPTTLTAFSFTLTPGEPVSLEYGAVKKDTAGSATPEPNGLSIQMSIPVRIGLSALVAVLAMAFIGAVGMIVYSLFLHRRR